MSDGSGIVSLEGIHQNANGDAKWIIEDPVNYWSYEYNPCNGFTYTYTDYEQVEHTFTNQAVLQRDYYNYEAYDLGTQDSEYFNYTDSSGLYIHYLAKDQARTTRINLLCNRVLPAHLFYFIGELSIAEYDFILEGPCACPGGCNKDGIIQPTNNGGDSGPTSLKWDTVSYDLVSLFLHDLILVVIIGIIVFVMTFFFGYQCACLTKSAGGGGLTNVNYGNNA